jgi:hypothetical protein
MFPRVDTVKRFEDPPGIDETPDSSERGVEVPPFLAAA